MKFANPARLCLALSLATLCACTGGGTPNVIHVNLAADKRLNPDPRNAAVPTQVRLYVLSSPEKFAAADYFQLVDHEQEQLGATLLASDQITVRPGEKRTVDLKAGPGAKFVAIAASFRDIDRATWHASLAVPSSGQVAAKLAGDRVTLAPGS